MAPTIQQLIEQKAALERQIAAAQHTMRADAIAKARALMTEYGLTTEDLVTSPGRAPKPAGEPRKSAAVKYRDSATGNTWTGRGIKPRWLSVALESGQTLADFTI